MSKRKKDIILSAAAGAAVAFAGTSIFYNLKYHDLDAFRQADYFIDKYFYSDNEVNKDQLVEGALSGYIGALDDKYSRYMTKVQTYESTNTQAGIQTGIGITVSLSEDNYLCVEEVNDDSPASRGGLKKGDIIIQIDGNDVAETGYNESVNMIKLKQDNSDVSVTVRRGTEMLDFTLKTENMEIKTVDSKMLENNTGYISISRFNEKTPEQMNKALDSLIASGAKGIIFDVRNNGGGLVTSVEKCLDPLLPKGDIAVAIYKNGKSDTIVRSDANELDMPMAVLTNEYSASGAELFSASLRDFKQVPLIGKNTYGKGVMQDTFMLSDSGSVTLTVAKYKTVKSDCYHGVGLKPDYEIEDDESTQTDEQLDAAIKVIKEKIS
ncbi:MAG: S41 family peptidase [Oscillospiraceae bacterium]|nr:S41 family peptidase [Oscillospiraceae bacterium]